MDFDRIDSILEEYRQSGYYPSTVCQIFDRKKTLYHKSFGDASPGTWYDLASVSKIVCTTMLLWAMEEGRLAAEDLALEYLPGEALGPVTKKRLEGVTIARLMTHTSGILPWYPFYADGREFYAVLEHALAASAVEEGMAYSDLNFMLLGQIFTYATGLGLREGLEKYIRGEMGIGEIAYGPVEPSLCAPSCFGNQIEKRMCAERGIEFAGWRPDGVEVRGTCNDGNAYYYWKGASGHAGTFGSSRALTKLCQFYMNTDRPNFLRAMETDICGRGLGFDRSDVYPEGCGHSGFTGTSIWFSRGFDIGAVILTNKYYRPEGGPVANSNEFRRAVHYALLAARGCPWNDYRNVVYWRRREAGHTGHSALQGRLSMWQPAPQRDALVRGSPPRREMSWCVAARPAERCLGAWQPRQEAALPGCPICPEQCRPVRAARQSASPWRRFSAHREWPEAGK